MEKTEHDLLIEINRDLGWMKNQFVDHVKDNAAFHLLIHNKVDAAHHRIDWLMVVGILSVIGLGFSIWLK